MSEKKKSNIQKTTDLLEDNGFHVILVHEEPPNILTSKNGTILLRISPKEEVKN